MRFLALLTANIFLLTTLAWSAPALPQPFINTEVTEKNLDQVLIPESLGHTESVHEDPSADYHIFYIQDAHSVIDAQLNIQQLIEYLQKEHGVSLVALEGTSGELDPTLLKAFPDDFVKEKVLRDYLARGELTGSQMASVLSESSGDFVGIENTELYEANYAAYLKAAEVRDSILDQLDTVENLLDQERAQFYSKSLNEFHLKVSAFQKEYIHLADLLSYLQKEFLLEGFEHERFPFLSSVLSSMEVNEKNEGLDLDVSLKEMADAFKKKFTDRLSAADFKEFNQQHQSYLTGKVDPGSFLKGMLGLAKKIGVSPKLSPEMKAVLGSEESLSMIRGSRLFDELLMFLSEKKNQLAENRESRDLIQRYERLNVLRELAKLELLPNQLTELMSEPDAYLKLLETSRAEMQRSEIRFALEFYGAALERDQVFMEKLRGLLASKKRKAAIVLTGGFHARGLETQFEQAGFSYTTIMPKMQSMAGHETYDLMMKGKFSYGRYLGESFYDGFMRHALLKLIEELDEPSFRKNLKFWRDETIRLLARDGRVSDARKYTRYLDMLYMNYFEKYQRAEVLNKSKEEVLSLVEDELERFTGQVKDSLWSRFQNRLAQLRFGLESLQQKGEVNEQNVASLLRTVQTQNPAALLQMVQSNFVVGAQVPRDLLFNAQFPDTSQFNVLNERTTSLPFFTTESSLRDALLDQALDVSAGIPAPIAVTPELRGKVEGLIRSGSVPDQSIVDSLGSSVRAPNPTQVNAMNRNVESVIQTETNVPLTREEVAAVTREILVGIDQDSPRTLTSEEIAIRTDIGNVSSVVDTNQQLILDSIARAEAAAARSEARVDEIQDTLNQILAAVQPEASVNTFEDREDARMSSEVESNRGQQIVDDKYAGHELFYNFVLNNRGTTIAQNTPITRRTALGVGAAAIAGLFTPSESGATESAGLSLSQLFNLSDADYQTIITMYGGFYAQNGNLPRTKQEYNQYVRNFATQNSKFVPTMKRAMSLIQQKFPSFYREISPYLKGIVLGDQLPHGDAIALGEIGFMMLGRAQVENSLTRDRPDIELAAVIIHEGVHLVNHRKERFMTQSNKNPLQAMDEYTAYIHDMAVRLSDANLIRDQAYVDFTLPAAIHASHVKDQNFQGYFARLATLQEDFFGHDKWRNQNDAEKKEHMTSKVNAFISLELDARRKGSRYEYLGVYPGSFNGAEYFNIEYYETDASQKRTLKHAFIPIKETPKTNQGDLNELVKVFEGAIVASPNATRNWVAMDLTASDSLYFQSAGASEQNVPYREFESGRRHVESMLKNPNIESFVEKRVGQMLDRTLSTIPENVNTNRSESRLIVEDALDDLKPKGEVENKLPEEFANLEVERFELADLWQNRQGWTKWGILEILDWLGIDRSDFSLDASSWTSQDEQAFQRLSARDLETLIQFVNSTPIFVNVLPDLTSHLKDGNHRVKIAELLGMTSLPAYVSRPGAEINFNKLSEALNQSRELQREPSDNIAEKVSPSLPALAEDFQIEGLDVDVTSSANRSESRQSSRVPEMRLDHFGNSEIDLIQVVEVSVKSVLPEVPLMSVVGSYTYVRDDKGNPRWDMIDDFDFVIYADVTPQQKSQIMQNVFTALGEAEGIEVFAPGINESNSIVQGALIPTWAIVEPKTGVRKRLTVSIESPNALLGRGSEQSFLGAYRPQSIYFGNRAVLKELLTNKTTDEIAEIMLDFYANGLEFLKSDVEAPGAFEGQKVKALKRFYQLAALRGMNNSMRWLLDAYRQMTVNYDDAKFNDFYQRALNALEVADKDLLSSQIKRSVENFQEKGDSSQLQQDSRSEARQDVEQIFRNGLLALLEDDEHYDQIKDLIFGRGNLLDLYGAWDDFDGYLEELVEFDGDEVLSLKVRRSEDDLLSLSPAKIVKSLQNEIRVTQEYVSELGINFDQDVPPLPSVDDLEVQSNLLEGDAWKSKKIDFIKSLYTDPSLDDLWDGEVPPTLRSLVEGYVVQAHGLGQFNTVKKILSALLDGGIKRIDAEALLEMNLIPQRFQDDDDHNVADAGVFYAPLQPYEDEDNFYGLDFAVISNEIAHRDSPYFHEKKDTGDTLKEAPLEHLTFVLDPRKKRVVITELQNAYQQGLISRSGYGQAVSRVLDYNELDNLLERADAGDSEIESKLGISKRSEARLGEPLDHRGFLRGLLGAAVALTTPSYLIGQERPEWQSALNKTVKVDAEVQELVDNLLDRRKIERHVYEALMRETGLNNRNRMDYREFVREPVNEMVRQRLGQGLQVFKNADVRLKSGEKLFDVAMKNVKGIVVGEIPYDGIASESYDVILRDFQGLRDPSKFSPEGIAAFFAHEGYHLRQLNSNDKKHKRLRKTRDNLREELEVRRAILPLYEKLHPNDENGYVSALKLEINQVLRGANYLNIRSMKSAWQGVMSGFITADVDFSGDLPRNFTVGDAYLAMSKGVKYLEEKGYPNAVFVNLTARDKSKPEIQLAFTEGGNKVGGITVDKQGNVSDFVEPQPVNMQRSEARVNWYEQMTPHVVAGQSLGRDPDKNEDSLYVNDALGLLIVADGVGGRDRGDLASEATVQIVRDHVERHIGRARTPEEAEQIVEQGLRKAHDLLVETNTGMGTTISIALIWQDLSGNQYLIGINVGDSRIVLQKKGEKPKQVTRDDTFVQVLYEAEVITEEQMEIDSRRNQVTNFVGLKASAQGLTSSDGIRLVESNFIRNPDGSFIRMNAGDRVYGYTDGAGDNLGARQIHSFLEKGESVDANVRKLVHESNIIQKQLRPLNNYEEAHRKKSPDDITVAGLEVAQRSQTTEILKTRLEQLSSEFKSLSSDQSQAFEAGNPIFVKVGRHFFQISFDQGFLGVEDDDYTVFRLGSATPRTIQHDSFTIGRADQNDRTPAGVDYAFKQSVTDIAERQFTIELDRTNRIIRVLNLSGEIEVLGDVYDGRENEEVRDEELPPINVSDTPEWSDELDGRERELPVIVPESYSEAKDLIAWTQNALGDLIDREVPLEIGSVFRLGSEIFKVLPKGRLLNVNQNTAQSRVVELEEGKSVIGRDRNRANIVVTSGNVSRVHAEVNLNDGKLTLKDLDSKNGTTLYLGKRSEARANLPKAENLRVQGSATESTWKLRDLESGKIWYLKKDGFYKWEKLGRLIAAEAGVNVPEWTELSSEQIEGLKIDRDYFVEKDLGDWIETSTDQRFKTFLEEFNQEDDAPVILTRDFKELKKDNLAQPNTSGLEELIAFMVFSVATDIGFNQNAERVTIDGLERFVVFDLTSAGFDGTKGSLPQTTYVVEPGFLELDIDVERLKSAIRRIQAIDATEFSAEVLQATGVELDIEGFKERQAQLPQLVADGIRESLEFGPVPTEERLAKIEALSTSIETFSRSESREEVIDLLEQYFYRELEYATELGAIREAIESEGGLLDQLTALGELGDLTVRITPTSVHLFEDEGDLLELSPEAILQRILTEIDFLKDLIKRKQPVLGKLFSRNELIDSLLTLFRPKSHSLAMSRSYLDSLFERDQKFEDFLNNYLDKESTDDVQWFAGIEKWVNETFEAFGSYAYGQTMEFLNFDSYQFEDALFNELNQDVRTLWDLESKGLHDEGLQAVEKISEKLSSLNTSLEQNPNYKPAREVGRLLAMLNLSLTKSMTGQYVGMLGWFKGVFSNSPEIKAAFLEELTKRQVSYAELNSILEFTPVGVKISVQTLSQAELKEFISIPGERGFEIYRQDDVLAMVVLKGSELFDEREQLYFEGGEAEILHMQGPLIAGDLVGHSHPLGTDSIPSADDIDSRVTMMRVAEFIIAIDSNDEWDLSYSASSAFDYDDFTTAEILRHVTFDRMVGDNALSQLTELGFKRAARSEARDISLEHSSDQKVMAYQRLSSKRSETREILELQNRAKSTDSQWLERMKANGISPEVAWSFMSTDMNSFIETNSGVGMFKAAFDDVDMNTGEVLGLIELSPDDVGAAAVVGQGRPAVLTTYAHEDWQRIGRLRENGVAKSLRLDWVARNGNFKPAQTTGSWVLFDYYQTMLYNPEQVLAIFKDNQDRLDKAFQASSLFGKFRVKNLDRNKLKELLELAVNHQVREYPEIHLIYGLALGFPYESVSAERFRDDDDEEGELIFDDEFSYQELYPKMAEILSEEQIREVTGGLSFSGYSSGAETPLESLRYYANMVRGINNFAALITDDQRKAFYAEHKRSELRKNIEEGQGASPQGVQTMRSESRGVEGARSIANSTLSLFPENSVPLVLQDSSLERLTSAVEGRLNDVMGKFSTDLSVAVTRPLEQADSAESVLDVIFSDEFVTVVQTKMSSYVDQGVLDSADIQALPGRLVLAISDAEASTAISAREERITTTGELDLTKVKTDLDVLKVARSELRTDRRRQALSLITNFYGSDAQVNASVNQSFSDVYMIHEQGDELNRSDFPQVLLMPQRLKTGGDANVLVDRILKRNLSGPMLMVLFSDIGVNASSHSVFTVQVPLEEFEAYPELKELVLEAMQYIYDIYPTLGKETWTMLAQPGNATKILNLIPVTARGVLEQLLTADGQNNLGVRLQTVFEVYAQVSQAA